MDNRMDMRLPIRLPVQVVTPHLAVEGTTVDLSFGGAYIRLPADLSTGLSLYQNIQVQFEPTAAAIDVPAIVARQDERGLGLMFGNYAPTADDYLTNRISKFFVLSF